MNAIFSDKNPRLSEEGLNFLLLLVDVQVLFDAALGLYDFDLVEFVCLSVFNVLMSVCYKSSFLLLYDS